LARLLGRSNLHNTGRLSQHGIHRPNTAAGFGINVASFEEETCYSGGQMQLDNNIELNVTFIGTGMHPYHQHINHFQVITKSNTADEDDYLYAIGAWHDTIPVQDNTATVRFKSADFSGSVMLHCHILAPEDRGMMGA
jgi:FtsP/CotA-like multicopper oxidase with cupredoxin domain